MPTAVKVNEQVEQWWPLAGGIARQWGQRFPWLTADFESEAGFALWRLAQLRGCDGDARFPGLVRSAVRFAILRRLESERLHNPTAFVPRTTAADPDADELLDLAEGREGEPGAALEVADELAALLARANLTLRQIEVVVRTAGAGESAEAVAGEQGVSRGRVHQIAAAALAKLRAAAGVA